MLGWDRAHVVKNEQYTNTHCRSIAVSVIFLLLLENMKILSHILFKNTFSEFQTVCDKIRTNILKILIWVQTICKG